MLYTAKQAAVICGISDTALQIALDREHVKATTVPQGARTYRQFTKDQLFSLAVFSDLTGMGVKPSEAEARVGAIEKYLRRLQFARGLKYIVFTCANAIPFFVQEGDSLEGEIGGFGGYVVSYQAIMAHIESATRDLNRIDRHIELQQTNEQK